MNNGENRDRNETMFKEKMFFLSLKSWQKIKSVVLPQIIQDMLFFSTLEFFPSRSRAKMNFLDLWSQKLVLYNS